jgi:hypothetical protein
MKVLEILEREPTLKEVLGLQVLPMQDGMLLLDTQNQ